MIVFTSLTEAFWYGFTIGAASLAVLTMIIIIIVLNILEARNKPCKKCGKPHKDCICEKVPTKRELMKEIKKFQKKQEIEILKERLEIMKKGDNK